MWERPGGEGIDDSPLAGVTVLSARETSVHMNRSLRSVRSRRWRQVSVEIHGFAPFLNS